MVDLNLAQFFTGGPQRGQGINPNSPVPMQRGQRGMLSGAPSHADKLQLAMSQLDQNNVEDLAKLAKILQATGDTAGAVKVLKRIEDIRKAEASATEKQAESEQEARVRENTYNILTELGLPKMADAYQRGGISQDQAGSIIKARGAELRKPEETGTQASLTKTEQKIYKALFEQDEKFGDYFGEGDAWWGDDKNRVLILMNKAEEIYAANPKIGRKKAADIALNFLKYGTGGSGSDLKEEVKEKPKDKWKGIISTAPLKP